MIEKRMTEKRGCLCSYVKYLIAAALTMLIVEYAESRYVFIDWGKIIYLPLMIIALTPTAILIMIFSMLPYCFIILYLNKLPTILKELIPLAISVTLVCILFTSEIVPKSETVMNEKKIEKMKLTKLSSKMHNSSCIYEKYPNVQKIEIAYKSESGSWEHAEENGKRIFTPNDRAVFLIGCPNSTCTGIGFDLGHEVDKLYLHKEESLSGHMVCTEYEDAEKYGKFRCGSSIDYVITICYER